MKSVLAFFVGGFLTLTQLGLADELLFEDSFENGLSEKWQVVGLSQDEYRVRDGGFEMRVQSEKRGQIEPMLRIELPFNTSESVIASVDVTTLDEPLERGEFAGLALTHSGRVSFRVRKTNIDGYFVFAPGEPEFIGKSGEEGDPGKYTVKYWPADKSAGPMKIIVRGEYAYFQVGPSTDDKYQTFFHSAIEEGKDGMGFALVAAGSTDEKTRWVRFDNFRVTKR